MLCRHPHPPSNQKEKSTPFRSTSWKLSLHHTTPSSKKTDRPGRVKALPLEGRTSYPPPSILPYCHYGRSFRAKIFIAWKNYPIICKAATSLQIHSRWGHSFQLTLVIEQVLLINTFLVCESPTIAQWAEGIACTSTCAGSLNFFLVGVPSVSRVPLPKKEGKKKKALKQTPIASPFSYPAGIRNLVGVRVRRDCWGAMIRTHNIYTLSWVSNVRYHET